MRWLLLFSLGVCLSACEGAEIAIFSVTQGGAAGASGTSGASGLSGAASAGAAGASAGADPGGNGGTSDAGSSGAPAAGSGGAIQPACSSIADCDAGYFCSKQRCEDAQGVCVVVPIPEDDTSDTPVCGCDHNVYSNDTLRQAYSVAASSPGPCNSEPHTCFHDEDCANSGARCAHNLPPTAQCGSSPGPGRCWVTPGECPVVNSPQYQVCPPPGNPGTGQLSCVSRCEAIKSGHPYMQLPQDQSCP